MPHLFKGGMRPADCEFDMLTRGENISNPVLTLTMKEDKIQSLLCAA